MSIIAIGGVSPKTSLKDLIKVIARSIQGLFEALNFGPSKKGKACYIRLSEKLDPLQVIEKFNSLNVVKNGANLFAFIPDTVPDVPLAIKSKKIPEKLRKKLKIAPNYSKKHIINVSHEEIMKEMQIKYTELSILSAKSKHALLRALGQEVYDRLVQIMNTSNNVETCFLLTKLYRKRHPHFGDFQFILTTLHKIQDEQGKPRSQIQESDLIKLTRGMDSVSVNNVPIEKIYSITTKYIERINQRLDNHIKKLKEETKPQNDSIEEAARLKVREHLINMEPYLPLITRDVINKTFKSTEPPFAIAKIYGEPFLPNKEALAPFVGKYRGTAVRRSEHIYNTISLRVPRQRLAALLAADGTLIGGSKLVIRADTKKIHKQDPTQFVRGPQNAKW